MELRLSGTDTEPENAWLFYAVIGLLPVAIYLEKFLPDLSYIDRRKLLDWVKLELTSVLLLPLLILLAQKLLSVLPVDFYHPSALATYIVLLSSLWVSPKLPRGESEVYSLFRVIRTGYFAWTLAFSFLVCSATGIDTFKFLRHNENLEYLYPPQKNPLPVRHKLTLRYNEDKVVFAMGRGLFTKILNEEAPPWLFFFVMFYMSHLYITLVFRCAMYCAFLLINCFVRPTSRNSC